MTTTTTRQTVASLRSTQVIFPDWMTEAVAGLTEREQVDVTRESTPFGSYVLRIERPECGAVADPARESRWITDPVCHEPAGHSGTHVCIEQRGERAGFHYTASPKVAEVARLDVEQRGYYDEATSCGASHNDAMEAALTYGYTR